MDEPIYIRKRLVCLTRNGDQSQAAEASAALRNIKGVFDARPVNNHRLSLTYSLEELSFELVEGLLKELGFYLDNSVFAMVRRTIYQYLEDNVREKIHADEKEQTLVCNVSSEDVGDEPEKYWNNYR